MTIVYEMCYINELALANVQFLLTAFSSFAIMYNENICLQSQ